MRTRPRLPHAFTDYEHEDEFDLFRAFNGGSNVARVGRIPRLLARAIGASTTIVVLSRTTAQKIRSKHPEITFQDLLQLSSVLHEGACYREGALHLAFLYDSPSSAGKVKAVIKATKDGKEVFVKTLHPIGGHRLKALLKKTMVVRDK